MFISLEGIEGSGKSTLAAALRDKLEGLGRRTLLTREPGGSGLGGMIRPLLVSAEADPCPEAELFLFLADRAQHAREIIAPALKEGIIVISDRYMDSTVAYQGYGRGMDVARLEALNAIAVGDIVPDVTLIPDLPVETGLARAKGRNDARGTAVSDGRFEAEEMGFHTRVRNGFRDMAGRSGGRIVLLDGTMTQDALLTAAMRVLMPHLL